MKRPFTNRRILGPLFNLSESSDLDCKITKEGRELANKIASEVSDKKVPASFWVDNNLEVVGRGEERIAVAPKSEGFIEGDCIIKVSLDLPPDQNRREITNWNAAPSEVKEVFAPIIAHGDDNRWLLMPRADEEGTAVDLVRIEETLEENGWSCRGLHPGNIGRFNGEPRVIDYGFRCIENGEVIR